MTGARGRLMQASTHPHNHDVAANRYCPVVVKTGKVGPLRSLVAPRGTVASTSTMLQLAPSGQGVRRNLCNGLRDRSPTSVP
jgi:hypothetical protein